MEKNKLIEIFKTALKEEMLETNVEHNIDLLGSEYKPDLVIYPQSVDDLIKAVRLANEHKIPLYPIGSSSKFKSAVAPFTGGVLISTKRLNKIIEYRPDNMSIEVEAGMKINELQEALAKDNIFYPVEDRFTNATIGGQVAANSYGRKKYMYKSARFYVMGLEFVSPQGELVRVGGRTVKNVSGYDVSQLLTGSWGVLGIITKVTLRVRPIPQKRTQLEYITEDFSKVTEVIDSILKEQISLASLTFRKTDRKYLLQLELEGFVESLELQVNSLKDKYGFKDGSKSQIEVNNYSEAIISLPLDTYCQGLKEIEALKDSQGLIYQGNITNGLVELNSQLLNQELVNKITSVVNDLQGTLVYQGQRLTKKERGTGYIKVLKNLKSVVDPHHILIPQSLVLKE
jgi:glycolate oxidase